MTTSVAVPPSRSLDPVARAVALHAVGWFVAANAVGVWLAAILVWPALGDLLAPLSYGRWMPLHHNWQLYGWCSLPLVGVLMTWILTPEHPGRSRHARVALGAWSLALGLGGLSWLSGVVSGKLFLDWHGWAQPLLPLAMLVLWTVLAAHVWWRRGELTRGGRWARWAVIGALAAVPTVMYFASERSVYPPVNPDSGGATGASLLGSTLGIIMIYGALPRLLGRPVVVGASRWGGEGVFWASLAVSWMVFGLIDHGHASHHAWDQLIGLAALIAWVPLAWCRFRAFAWPPGVRWALVLAFTWWLALVANGYWSFLPGVAERLKFTDGLVAHAHLAMAGLVTSMNLAILGVLLPGAMKTTWPFWLWQAGCAVQVAVLLALGWWQGGAPGDAYRSDVWMTAGYAVRLMAGVGMLLASAMRLRDVLKCR